MQTLQKMKILGVERSGIIDAEYDSTPRVLEGWWHGWRSTFSDDNPNVLNADRDDDGRWVSTYWDNPDNQWNDNGAFAFSVPANLFISHPASSGVEF